MFHSLSDYVVFIIVFKIGLMKENESQAVTFTSEKRYLSYFHWIN